MRYARIADSLLQTTGDAGCRALVVMFEVQERELPVVDVWYAVLGITVSVEPKS